MLTAEVNIENRCRLLCTEVERYGDVGMNKKVAHEFAKSIGYTSLAGFTKSANGVLRFDGEQVILTKIGKEYLGRWR